MGELAGRCLTELTPAWLMVYVLLWYLMNPCLSLRLIWRLAGLIDHRNSLYLIEGTATPPRASSSTQDGSTPLAPRLHVAPLAALRSSLW